MVDLGQIFEALMVISFGIAWPTSILKSYKARTTKGKSLQFLFIILAGYAFGITSKFVSNKLTYVLIFYIINFIMVSIDLCLYYRNSKIDKQSHQ